MSTKIFYFSATGNSLNVARCITSKLEDTELISIAEVLNKNIEITCEKIGFIFPVYVWGMPQIVVDFISSFKLSYNQYIFAVITCGGTPGGALLQLKKLLKKKGADLNAGFAIRQESHSPLKQVPIEKFIVWLNRNKRPVSIKKRLDEIIETIEEKKYHEPEIGSKMSAFLGTTILHKNVLKELRTYSSKFSVDENCVLCGTCQKVCPRENIKKRMVR